MHHRKKRTEDVERGLMDFLKNFLVSSFLFSNRYLIVTLKICNHVPLLTFLFGNPKICRPDYGKRSLKVHSDILYQVSQKMVKTDEY